jgi:hypothetical protein
VVQRTNTDWAELLYHSIECRALYSSTRALLSTIVLEYVVVVDVRTCRELLASVRTVHEFIATIILHPASQPNKDCILYLPFSNLAS